MAASIHATNRASGGCRRSTPVTSAANSGCSGLARGSISCSSYRSLGRRVEEMQPLRVHREPYFVAGAEPRLRVDAGHGEARLPGPRLDQHFRAELLDHLDPGVEARPRDPVAQHEMLG